MTMLIQSYKYATFDAKLIIFYSPIPRKSPMADPDIRLGVQACDGQRDWAKGDLICFPVSHAYFFVCGIESIAKLNRGTMGGFGSLGSATANCHTHYVHVH